jgi:quinoprotein glucose dehydrogenase
MARKLFRFGPAAIAVLLVVAGVGVSGQVGVGPQQSAVRNGEWRRTGADGNTRYSPLDQITAENIKNLRVVWSWKGDNFGSNPEIKNETTPIYVDGVLYFSIGERRSVVAVDPGTGETLWTWRLDEGARANGVRKNHRGVSYWTDGRESRILTVTPSYQLVSLDAKTGQPDVSFGRDGIVDMTREVEKDANYDTNIGHLMNTSPPLVFGNVAIIPTSMENARNPKSMKFPKADLMAFDVRTGRKLWTFHTTPRKGEFGEDTWLTPGSNLYTGHTGAWAPFTVDEQLGYAYIPVESPTGDQFGGQRPGNNLFSSSIVCIDIKTGKRIWHYQLVHHDIWDFDMPAAPILADINVNGKPIKAVVQPTKSSFVYVFDRTNGQPVWPIEERPVPQSDVPGEHTAPTQPFPLKPPAVDRQGLTEADLIDYTPELKAAALKAIQGYRIGPMFTPPSLVDPAKGLKGTFTFPGSGGIDWEGGAFDPETGLLFIGSATRSDTAVYGVQPAKPGETDLAMVGTPSSGPTLQRLPVVKPPWTRITAINLNTGDMAWQVPNGPTPDWVKNHPLLKGVTNLPQTGALGRAPLLMVTKTLLFSGSGYNTDPPAFRAYDKKTGALIWEVATAPGPPNGVPMTYMHRGKQYILVAVQGDPATRTGTQILAYAIPDSPKPGGAATE